MSTDSSLSTGSADKEISELIETLHRTGQRLEELTAGEVDTVANRTGRTVVLKRAQDYMRLNEASRQAAILNALPANIALLDNQGSIISVNEAWRQFGRANALQGPEHEIGVNYLEVCDSAHGENASEASQAAAGIRSVLRGELTTFSLEYPCHSPTERRWFLMTVTPVGGCSLMGAAVMHLNITERKTAELELKKSEKQLSEALTIAKIGYWEYEYATDEFIFNDQYYLLHETTVEEAGGYRMSSADFASRYLYPEDAHNVEQHVRWAFESRDPDYCARVEIRLLSGAGKTIWVDIRFRILKDLQGNTSHMIGVNQDITARKRAEETRDHLALTLEATTDIVAVSDPAGRLLYFNPAARNAFGWALTKKSPRRRSPIMCPTPPMIPY